MNTREKGALAPEARPSAAEAASHLPSVTARLKSCPDDTAQTDFMTASAPSTKVDLVAQTTEALEEGANDVDYRM